MSDFKFNCPHCQQRIGIPEAALGRTVACPGCKGRIQLPPKPQAAPEESQPPAPVQPRENEVKFSCPACDVHIVITARAAGKQISCQRCGAKITVPGVQPQPQPPAPTPVAPAPPPPPPEPQACSIPDLIARLRSGDLQAGTALIQSGETVIPALVEGFNEYSLEEPDTNRGADHLVNLLVKCGAASVPSLIAKLGKCRHAYLGLGQIGSEEAVDALARELASVNWRRAEIACRALGLVRYPGVLKALDAIETLRKSTRNGDVYSAASAAATAIRNRFPAAAAAYAQAPTLKAQVAPSQTAKVVFSQTASLKAMPAIRKPS